MLKRFRKAFWVTTFLHQNKHHKHGVIGHTLKVTYHLARKGHWKMVPAGLLHDLSKPLSAYKKPEDMGTKDYSFTAHEAYGYHIIKNWPVSDYTKDLVRYHYLIRGLKKERHRNPAKYKRLRRIWDNLDLEFKKDLAKFLVCDDLGKK